MKKNIILLLLFIIFSCKDFNKTNLFFYYEDSDEAELFLNEKIEIFSKNNRNIKINKFKKSKNDLIKDLKENKKKIDFIRYPSNFLYEFIEENIIKSCNDFIKKDFLNKFITNALETTTINDQIWGIPDNFINYPLLYYNKLIIKTPPKNVNEMIKTYNQMLYKKNDNFGIFINLKEPFFIYPWLNNFKINFFKDDKTLTINNKELTDALQFIYDLKYKYKIISTDLKQDDIDQFISNGNISMIIDGDWELYRYKTILKENLGISPIPFISKTSEDNYIFASTMCYSITKNTNGKSLKSVIKFLQFMNSIETQSDWIKKYRLPTLKIFEEDQYFKQLLFKDVWIVLLNSRSYPSNKNINLLNKALRPQLEKLIDDKISPKIASQNVQEYLEILSNKKIMGIK